MVIFGIEVGYWIMTSDVVFKFLTDTSMNGVVDISYEISGRLVSNTTRFG
jgi:hypothetical protein